MNRFILKSRRRKNVSFLRAVWLMEETTKMPNLSSENLRTASKDQRNSNWKLFSVVYSVILVLITPTHAQLSDARPDLSSYQEIRNVPLLNLKTEALTEKLENFDVPVSEVTIEQLFENAEIEQRRNEVGFPLNTYLVRSSEKEWEAARGSNSLNHFNSIYKSLEPVEGSPEYRKFDALQAEYSKAFENYHALYMQGGELERKGELTSEYREQILKASNGVREHISELLYSAIVREISLPSEAIGQLLLQEQARKAEYKAVYGSVKSVYRPDVYAHVLTNSASVGRIDASHQTLGSCVLIGDNLVITANHVIGFMTKDDFTVTFDEYESGKDYSYTVEKILAKQPKFLSDDGVNTVLDIAFLEIKPTDDPREIKPLSLSRTHFQANQPVYIIGYPQLGGKGGFLELHVHDDAKILFPYRLHKGQVSNMFLEVASYFIFGNLNIVAQSNDIKFGFTSDAADKIEEHWTLFQTLYNWNVGQSEEYFFYRDQWSIDYKVPLFGIESDTFKGNSGGAVFLKSDTYPSLIGIFVSGQTDRAESYDATIMEHEHVIPSSAIIDMLSKKFPELITNYNIQIK